MKSITKSSTKKGTYLVRWVPFSSYRRKVMLTHTVTQDHINSFRLHLVRAEKSLSTISKYIHDVSAFFQMVNDAPVTQELLIEYKQSLINQFQPTSVNSMLAALNHFFKWMGWELHVN